MKMTPIHDSDSSDGEDRTETNVLLGYPIDDSQDETVTRLGGPPDWLGGPSRPPLASLARCKVCNSMMVLLLQLNGELPDQFPGHERRLYVFACRRQACRRREGCVRALRGVRVVEGYDQTDEKTATPKGAEREKAEKGMGNAKSTPAAPPVITGAAIFGGKGLGSLAGSGHNPFTTSAAASTPSSPKKAEPTEQSIAILPTSFEKALSLSNPIPHHRQPLFHGPTTSPEPWPPQSNLPPPYTPSFLYADYETLEPVRPEPPQPFSVHATENDSTKEDHLLYESAMDTVFQKFADRAGQNPEQCIRYEFGGAPLLYSEKDPAGKALFVADPGPDSSKQSKGMPRCANCGACRTFEFQLMPHAIEVLEGNEPGLGGMDWGTIIVGVCKRDCQERGQKVGETGYVEEWAGVQWEDLLNMS